MSEPNTLLRIDRLRVQNFRCFASCSLDLHPTLTVLVADNAQGKTALLDALRIGLSAFVTTIGKSKLQQPFRRSDIHRVLAAGNRMENRLPCGYEIQGEINSKSITWHREVLANSGRTLKATFKGLSAMEKIADSLSLNAEPTDNNPTAGIQILPVVAYYGTGRLYDEHRLTKEKRLLASVSPARISAYLDCLSSSSSYKAFVTWFGRKWDQITNPQFRALGFDTRPENYLAAVRNAVSTVLDPTGWTTVYWEQPAKDDNGRIYEPGHLALEHPEQGRLPLSHLSDGVRNMVALVGDLAHRCVRLNPFLGEEAARRTPGIVMIDEVDMHLHPRWQQLAVGLLQSAFPNVQFVLSTHSPHVLTTVRKEHIRVIASDEQSNWSTLIPDNSPLGQESGDALAFIMGAHPRPQLPLLDDVHAFEQMARAGKAQSCEALAILERLNQSGFEFTDAQKALFALLAKKSQSTSPDHHG